MMQVKTNPKVDAFLAKAKAWGPEMARLRQMLLASGLDEEFKWYKPCYSYQGGNVVILAGLKHHCWLAFFKGAVLEDPAGVLEKAGENTQGGRVVKFTSLEQIETQAAVIRALLASAIAAEAKGLQVEMRPAGDFDLPEELVTALDADSDFAEAFQALTPGRQRGWCLHFAGAKQSATRASRVEKAKPLILAGKGMHDRD
jgi:uncharacterized protein YdeI (YjbR/CyaY-like superfamily)